MSTPTSPARVSSSLHADHDAARVDVVDLAAAARLHRGARVDRRRALDAGADERLLRRAGRAPPDAACSSPSARGWRRRARGTESAKPPPTRSATAPRPCTRPCRRVDSMNSFLLRQDTSSSTSLPFLSSCAFACAITYWPSSIADRYIDLVGDLAVLHLAVRRLEEAVLVGARVQRERVDQADVRTFRRLDRAHAAVVRRMHVAHFEAGALAREAARAQAPTRGACA